MASQLDLDQGGIYRESVRAYMGPTIGWLNIPQQWVVNVTSGGVFTIGLGTNSILVNFNGAVTIQLPKFKGVAAGPQAVPGQFAVVPITISDVGGFATANPITVLPGAGETISGLASAQITTNFGSLVIRPDPINGGGTFMQ